MAQPSLDWRKIEAALIATFARMGFVLEYDKGNTFIRLAGEDFALSDLAQHLAQELAL